VGVDEVDGLDDEFNVLVLFLEEHMAVDLHVECLEVADVLLEHLRAAVDALPVLLLPEELTCQLLVLLVAGGGVAQAQTEAHLFVVQLHVQVAQLPLAVADANVPLLLQPVLGTALQLLVDAGLLVLVFEVDLRDFFKGVQVMLGYIQASFEFLNCLFIIATFNLY
jgi:hypothetical protein